MASLRNSKLIPPFHLGVRLRDGEIVKLHAQGRIRFPWLRSILGNESLQIFDLWNTQLTVRTLESWVRHPDLAARLHIVRLGASERAIVWRDDCIFRVLGPGLHAFWKEPAEVRIERYDVTESAQLEFPGIETMTGEAELRPFVQVVRAQAGFVRVVLREGQILDFIESGVFVYWRGPVLFEVRTVDMREQTAVVGSQDIMTRDKVSLRTSLIVTWKVSNVARAVMATADLEGTVYREAQLALRAVVGTRTLDQFLADKDLVGERVHEMLKARAAALGAEVLGVGVKDVMLPGEMKAILNQVITATKEAEANVIRRREDTAAARSQANTAKLLAANPALARMRELEALSDLLRGMNATFVLGPSDIAGQVTGLLGEAADKATGS